MLVPNGKVSPGLGFFRALHNLARPEQAGQAAQAKAAAKPVAAQQASPTQAKAAPDHVQAARPADPGTTAAPATEGGKAYPRGSFLDIKV
jgi:hypothetical protein